VNTADSFLEQTSQFYERALSGVLSQSMLLYFSYADFEELNMKFEKVHKIYQRCIDVKDIDPTLCYIQYLKFCRRAEGIKSARGVFKKAREDPRSNFHVYVSAALMEYYCSKDKSVAFKIFELGLKKFNNSPEYIMAYLDYLSNLNEDNNTRVLFERILSSGQIPAKDSIEIWNKFLEFESNIGDLASIIKVEQRRSKALQEAGMLQGDDTDHKYTCNIIDRYRFMNLLPLTRVQLKSIGYVDTFRKDTQLLSNLSKRSGKQMSAFSSASIKLNGFFDSDNLARPDFSQMVPFKPKVNYRPGEFMVPGGVFPMPPTAAELNQKLPPPYCFKGPFVKIDKLCEMFDRIRLPDLPVSSGTDANSVHLFDLAKSVQWIGGEDKKRKSHSRLDDSDDDSSISAPTNDIYRMRQQKKIK